ncbi:flagellar motor switch protein FliG [Candidatus Desulfofervidus auxilii]|uniref:Flagellar motor switch protein FliG n=1 Tax=Desulfofervidus auxilii TaxID=1621989 RepID=A0A7U4QJJ3_DESA2|nr:flagellar motor switch protein FliG [Candidatus Desulfofervidus auxilii]AMM40532.1 flagellar motor switch protein FliG [Candidatus Desulfofervidus auxilii]
MDSAKDRKLKGPEKAAIFLFSLGEELAAQFIKELSPEEIKRLSDYMKKVEVSPELFKEVNKEIKQKLSLPIEGKNFIKNVISKAVGEKEAEYILGKESDFLRKINEINPDILVNFLRHENPQTIAFIVSNLKPENASTILANLPNGVKTEVILRMAQLDTVSVDIIKSIDEVLKEEIFKKEVISEVRKVGGLEKVAEILNRVEHSTQQSILEEIEKTNPELASEIKKKMFVFDDLVNIEDRGMQILLKHIKMEDLVLALKTASDALKDKIFKNVSERVSEMIKEDLEIMGAVRLSEVEKAQQTIIDTAKLLESEGKLVIPKKGEEEVFV